MDDKKNVNDLSVVEHAKTMERYMQEGTDRALALENRGPIKLDENGKLKKEILNAYWKYGFYVFKNVLGNQELQELRDDVNRVLDEAPDTPDDDSEQGLPVGGRSQFKRPPYRYAKPLSDNVGGTNRNKGRHPVKMLEPDAGNDAPAWTIELLHGNLHLMDSCLRLYGHPGLMAVAEAVNGPNFVPYNEVVFLKEPGLGPSVAWHQDGTTHWEAEDWDQGAHGFNFMTQLYPSTAGNGVWVLPGTHKKGKLDIRKMVKDSGSERIAEAVPYICDSGDVIISNRQLVHGSFANSSPDRRVTVNAGFFPYDRVLGVTTAQLDGTPEKYTKERIHTRSRIIALAIDARKQHFKDEIPYQYRPCIGEEADNQWNEANRKLLLHNYNLNDMYI